MIIEILSAVQAVVKHWTTSVVVLGTGVAFWLLEDSSTLAPHTIGLLGSGGTGTLIHAGRAVFDQTTKLKVRKASRKRIDEASRPRGPLIEQLTEPEIELLNSFFFVVTPNPAPKSLDRHDPVVQSLVRKGFLDRVADSNSESLDGHFQIRPWIYEHPWRGIFAKRVGDTLGVPLGGRKFGSAG